MKKLAYMNEKFTRVLQITDAPKSVKNRMVGRYLTNCGLYIYPSSNVKANLWTSKSFEKAKHYDETLRSIEDMRDYQKMLKRHGYATNILLVSNHVAAFDIGQSNDFDGDQISFYFTGIDNDGQQVFLRLMSPDAAKALLFYAKPGSGLTESELMKEYPWKVGEDFMVWERSPAHSWMTRNLPDEELIDHVNEFAKEFGVTNLMVGRLYR
jgi:hypothetical protein